MTQYNQFILAVNSVEYLLRMESHNIAKLGPELFSDFTNFLCQGFFPAQRLSIMHKRKIRDGDTTVHLILDIYSFILKVQVSTETF